MENKTFLNCLKNDELEISLIKCHTACDKKLVFIFKLYHRFNGI